MLSSNKEIKICKIVDFKFAKWCEINKINYLGVHILKYEDIGNYIELSKYINLSSSKLVIVTKIKKLNELKQLVKTYSPFGIQLHYPIPINDLKIISISFPNTKIFGVITDDSTTEYVLELDKYCYRIIYDTSFVGGTGMVNKHLKIDNFYKILGQKLLLAGGVNNLIINNNNLKLRGFDIQSYLKNKSTNENFINRLLPITKTLAENQISLSLTDLVFSVNNKTIDYIKLPIYDFHLDYSDGSLYKNFKTKLEDISDKIKILKDKPVSIHLFSTKDYSTIIEKFKFNNISRIFLQFYDKVSLDINTENQIIWSVYHEDFKLWMSQSKNKQISKISIILPTNIEKQNIFIEKLYQSNYLNNKEIWFDRGINIEIYKKLKEKFMNCNIIIGKEIHNFNLNTNIYDKLNAFKTI